jgi:outer membrane immunogenic protein
LGDLTTARHSYRQTDSSGTAGGQVGCLMQVGQIVLGGEADLNWSDVDTTVLGSFAPFPSANPAFTISQANEALSSRMNWFSTVRARGGVAFDRFLVFATGGLAIGHFNSTTSVVYGANGTSPVFANSSHVGSSSDTRLGLAIGGGVEYAFNNNWSIKAEYLHLHFEQFSYTSALVTPAVAAAAGYSWTTTVRPREDILRVGVNYRFNYRLGAL